MLINPDPGNWRHFPNSSGFLWPQNLYALASSYISAGAPQPPVPSVTLAWLMEADDPQLFNTSVGTCEKRSPEPRDSGTACLAAGYIHY